MVAVYALSMDYILPDKESDGATNEHIRREVLLGEYPRGADQSGVPIAHVRNPSMVAVFTGEDSGQGPRLGGVARRKGVAAFFKVPFVITVCRALPTSHDFHNIHDNIGVRQSLESKNAGLLQLFVVKGA